MEGVWRRTVHSIVGKYDAVQRPSGPYSPGKTFYNERSVMASKQNTSPSLTTRLNANSHPFIEQNQHRSPVLNTVVADPFVVASQTLTLQTDLAPHFLDLTPAVNSLVKQINVRAGTV